MIVRPANSPPVMVETLVRLKGELTSAGFETEIVDGAAAGEPAGDSRAGLEQLAARRGADAVVAIVGDLSPDSVEVWVIDKVTGKSVVRPRALRTGGDARVEDAGDPRHRAAALELSRDRSGGARSAATSRGARAAARRRPLRGDGAAGAAPREVRRRGRRRRDHEPGRRRSGAAAARALRLVAARRGSSPRRRWPASERARPSRARRAARRSRRRTGCSEAASVSARARGCVPSRRCPPARCTRRSRDAPTRRTRAASSTSGRFSSTRASVRSCACPIASTSRSRRTRSWPSRTSPFASSDAVVATSARPNLLVDAHDRSVAVRPRGGRAGSRSSLLTRRRRVLARRPRRDHALPAPTAAPTPAPTAAPPVTCPSPALQPGDSMQTVQVGGVSRSYVLHVPSAYDGSKPVPLIVDFHASEHARACNERKLSPYPDVTDPEGVVMAFPIGPRRSLGRGVERRAVLRRERRRRGVRPGAGGPDQRDGLHRSEARLRHRLLDGRRHGALPRVPRRRRVRGGGALRVRSAARERRRLPAAAAHHGDLVPWQRGQRWCRTTVDLLPWFPACRSRSSARRGRSRSGPQIDRCAGHAVGAGRQRMLDLLELPGRRRGRAVHEAGRRPGAGQRRHRLAGAQAASAAVRAPAPCESGPMGGGARGRRFLDYFSGCAATA